MHPSRRITSHTQYTTTELTSTDSWWHQLQLRHSTASFSSQAPSTTNGRPKPLRRTPLPRPLSSLSTSLPRTHILREQHLRNGSPIRKKDLHHKFRTEILCASGYRPSVARGAQKQYLQSAFIEQWSEYAPELLSTSSSTCRRPARSETIEGQKLPSEDRSRTA